MSSTFKLKNLYYPALNIDSPQIFALFPSSPVDQFMYRVYQFPNHLKTKQIKPPPVILAIIILITHSNLDPFV